jgi:hypothetical protein
MTQSVTVVKLLFKFLSKRWPICCLLFFVSASCNQGVYADHKKNFAADSIAQIQVAARASTQLRALEPMIHSGDLITRTGNDFTSESLREFNQRDQTFSHCGIASIENDTVFVYHALGGEFNPNQKIRRDPLQTFGEAYSNRGIGLFRYDLEPSEMDQLVFIAKKWYRDGVVFDMKFDLQTNERMYCAEYVYKALLAASGKRLSLSTSHIKSFEFVGVDDLYLLPQCVELKRIIFK